MPNDESSTANPRRSNSLTILIALAIAAFLGFAIYSFSRYNRLNLTPTLGEPALELTAGQDRPLPAFDVSLGERRLNADYFADRWTLLTFWSVTCPPCLVEMPSLNSMALGMQGSNFQVVTVNVDPAGDDLDAAKRFLEENQISLPTVFEGGESLKQAFQVDRYPTHFLVNPERKIVWTASVAYDWENPKTYFQLMSITGWSPPTAAPEDPEE